MTQQPSSDAAPQGADMGGEAPSAQSQAGEPQSTTPQTPRDSRPSELHAPLSITRQYVKDFSFENPNAPGIYDAYGEGGPELKVSVDITASAIGEKSHEVVLSLSVAADFAETTAFIVELHYGAQAMVDETLSQDKLERALMVEVPRYLFPFVRSIIANATRDGGFPPLLLSPINFGKVHDSRRQRQAAAGASGS